MRPTPPLRLRDERGQILAIVAGGMLALIAFLGLVTDAGVAFLDRRDGQSASDITSVDAARIVALNYTKNAADPDMNEESGPDNMWGQDDVYRTITASLAGNNCAAGVGTPCTWTAYFVRAGAVAGQGPVDNGQVGNSAAPIPANTIGVRVHLHREPGTFVIRIFGVTKWDILTEATAVTARPSQLPPGVLLPIAVCGFQNPATPADCPDSTSPGTTPVDYQPGQLYDLTDGKDAPGGFGWISWDGSNSAGALATSLCNPNNPPFSLPTWFPSDPGKTNAKQVRDCLDGWIDSGATVLIPIYDVVTGTGNNAQYHIVGVAAFVITSRSQPAIDNLQGYFVEYYPYTDVPGGLGSQPPSPNDQVYFLGLVR